MSRLTQATHIDAKFVRDKLLETVTGAMVEQVMRSNRSNRNNRSGRSNRSDRSDRGNRSDRSDRSNPIHRMCRRGTRAS